MPPREKVSISAAAQDGQRRRGRDADAARLVLGGGEMQAQHACDRAQEAEPVAVGQGIAQAPGLDDLGDRPEVGREP
jgi:hypothetical protein